MTSSIMVGLCCFFNVKDNSLCHSAQPGQAFQHHKHMPVMNVVVGSICLLLLSDRLLCFTSRIWRSNWRGMRW